MKIKVTSLSRMLLTLLAGLPFAFLLHQPQTIVNAQVVTAPGYQVELVAEGLQGPQSLTIVGSGVLAVGEAGAIPGRLTLVRPNGEKAVLATAQQGPISDVVFDPPRGFFTTNGSSPRRILNVQRNGEVSTFAITPGFPAAIALGLDGTLYVEELLPTTGTAVISAFDLAGQRQVFKEAIRADGLAIDRNGDLIATVAFRVITGTPPFPPLENDLRRINVVTGEETIIALVGGGRIGSLALDREGNFYITDWVDGKVRKVSSDGNSVEVILEGLSTGSQDLQTGVSILRFHGITVDTAGRIYVTDSLQGKLYKIMRQH